eukprot:scaffold172373_cov31-Tisochrysis_lutea.AAC.2
MLLLTHTQPDPELPNGKELESFSTPKRARRPKIGKHQVYCLAIAPDLWRPHLLLALLLPFLHLLPRPTEAVRDKSCRNSRNGTHHLTQQPSTRLHIEAIFLGVCFLRLDLIRFGLGVGQYRLCVVPLFVRVGVVACAALLTALFGQLSQQRLHLLP